MKQNVLSKGREKEWNQAEGIKSKENQSREKNGNNF